MIDWTVFTPLSALGGGALIGLAAVLLILGSGRILGMSGITTAMLSQLPRLSWQLVFVAGMAVATWGYALVPGFPTLTLEASPLHIIIAGVLVGFGTRLGSGCTSGHGVCGISRLSKRSLVATLTFMASGIATATLFHLLA